MPRPIEKSAMSQGVVQARSRPFTLTVAPSGCVRTLSATIWGSPTSPDGRW